jgi:hypothetical protein
LTFCFNKVPENFCMTKLYNFTITSVYNLKQCTSQLY